MSGAARIQMQQVQVARLAAPAAVLLAQLQATTLPVGTTLLQNPALLLQALDALHRGQALHRDLTPFNIEVDTLAIGQSDEAFVRPDYDAMIVEAAANLDDPDVLAVDVGGGNLGILGR